MKLSNNPTRRQERRLGALKRFVISAQYPTSRRPHPRTIEQAKAERDALTLKAHAEPLEWYRGHKTKKDRTAKAKFGRND